MNTILKIERNNSSQQSIPDQGTACVAEQAVSRHNAALPLVSAIITTFARPEAAKRAIESVFAQTYPRLEIIVVEDGSPSDLKAWLVEQGRTNVVYIRHEKNLGLAAARNTGLRLAQGQYVAYLDDDDQWKPARVDRQMQAFLAFSPAKLAACAVVSCGFDRIIPRQHRVTYGPPGNHGNLKDEILRVGAKTPSSTFLFRRAALEAVGGFDESLQSGIDHDIWMALAVHGYDAYAVNEALVINYDRFGQSTMMTDVVRRINGVRKYLHKWQPTLELWLGNARGKRYVQLYLARVIGNLAVNKLFQCQWRDAGIALRCVYSTGHYRWQSTAIVMRLFFAELIRQILPGRLIAFLRGGAS